MISNYVKALLELLSGDSYSCYPDMTNTIIGETEGQFCYGSRKKCNLDQ